MATPESIAAAFAKGMMEAMLAAGEKPEKKAKPTVAKVEDINAAVARYLDAKIAEEEAAPQRPVQPELFEPPGLDLGDAVLRRVQEARERAESAAGDDEMPPGYFDANLPGKPWTAPS